MKKASVLLVGLLLAACSPQETPQPVVNKPTQGQPLPGFEWVQKPLALWQTQSLYDVSYWVRYDPVQLSSYTRQTYQGNNTFSYEQYSLNYGDWKADPSQTLVFNSKTNDWAELEPTFTATEGPVGTSNVKSIYVTDASGTRYYSIQQRDLSGKPIRDGLSAGFGDGRSLPDVIKNGTATFSPGAKAYIWTMDQKDPLYTIVRTHYVFTSRDDVIPLQTCPTISDDCSSTASTLSEAISEQAWILNGGGNVSVRLLTSGKAEVRYTGEDGNASPQTFQVNYTYSPATKGAPERIVFDPLTSSDQNLTQAVSKLLSTGNGQLAVYQYDDQAVRGIYIPPQTGIYSKTYQYNKQAINDILTKWSPDAPPVVQ